MCLCLVVSGTVSRVAECRLASGVWRALVVRRAEWYGVDERQRGLSRLLMLIRWCAGKLREAPATTHTI